jgi:hypothetical protein
MALSAELIHNFEPADRLGIAGRPESALKGVSG